MENVLIIGSGPAAAGAALALTDAGIRPLIVDIGLRLEPELTSAVQRMSTASPGDWNPADARAISHQPIESLVDGLPEKRAYGSDFPFRDMGQISGITAEPGSHRSVVSPAFGGFSNVWGAQIMPFTPATFDDWPVTYDEMEPHYASVLRELPYAAADDDLSIYFPLIERPDPLPRLSERTNLSLGSYAKHRTALLHHGIALGQARLAMAAPACVHCGMCMTGCPYGLIYSASQTLDRLRDAGLIDYRPGLKAVRVGQERSRPFAEFVDQVTGAVEKLTAGKILVACGALGTTRLVAGSRSIFDRIITAGESAQFTLPMVSRRSTGDPRDQDDFTLNQFNMVIRSGPSGRDLSQVHFYSYNRAFLDALPPFLRNSGRPGVTSQVLRRLSVAIGYLPSWASPELRMRFSHAGDGALPHMSVSRQKPRWVANSMFRSVMASMLLAAPKLDLWPVIPQMMLAAGAKSYHFGGTFPHADPVQRHFTTDRTGNLADWPDIHLVDASVFPNVPATTFTLTIMANAHRIATELVSEMA
jgi:choline dehydrogenase-like flavoprotein